MQAAHQTPLVILEEMFLQLMPEPGRRVWPEHGIELIHAPARGELEVTWERPMLVAVIKGRKTGVLGSRQFAVERGQLLVVHLPMLASCASSDIDGAPFLAVSCSLHIETLIDLMRALEPEVCHDESAPDDAVVPVANLDHLGRATLSRLLLTLSDPVALRALAPGLRNELHFLGLSGPCGRLLRELMSREGRAGAIWRSVQAMRNNLTAPLSVGELARAAAMSKSLFYANFKLQTGCSPLQYQKRLRLERALEMLGKPGAAVSAVAHAVGYQSASQFSREFVRAYGYPPSLVGRTEPPKAP